MRPVTAAEHVRLVEVANRFWFRHGRNVAAALDEVAPDLEDTLLLMLEDRGSVHGSPFGRYRKPIVEGKVV